MRRTKKTKLMVDHSNRRLRWRTSRWTRAHRRQLNGSASRRTVKSAATVRRIIPIPNWNTQRTIATTVVSGMITSRQRSYWTQIVPSAIAVCVVKPSLNLIFLPQFPIAQCLLFDSSKLHYLGRPRVEKDGDVCARYIVSHNQASGGASRNMWLRLHWPCVQSSFIAGSCLLSPMWST